MNKGLLPPHRRISGLGLVVALGGAIGLASLSTQAARADGDGLKMQRDYEMRQINCARRWRDRPRNANISMLGCMGFNHGMPAAAKAALAEDQERAIAMATPTKVHGQVRQTKLATKRPVLRPPPQR